MGGDEERPGLAARAVSSGAAGGVRMRGARARAALAPALALARPAQALARTRPHFALAASQLHCPYLAGAESLSLSLCVSLSLSFSLFFDRPPPHRPRPPPTASPTRTTCRPTRRPPMTPKTFTSGRLVRDGVETHEKTGGNCARQCEAGRACLSGDASLVARSDSSSEREPTSSVVPHTHTHTHTPGLVSPHSPHITSHPAHNLPAQALPALPVRR